MHIGAKATRCLPICGLINQKRVNRLGCNISCFRLGPGKVLGLKFSRSVHGFAGNPGKTGFYSSIYITLYYRNIMLSICETGKPIELKFSGKLPVGPGIVLG